MNTLILGASYTTFSTINGKVFYVFWLFDYMTTAFWGPENAMFKDEFQKFLIIKMMACCLRVNLRIGGNGDVMRMC